MGTYTFSLILSADPTEEQVDRLYGHFQGDVLSGVEAGVPYLDCTISATSLDEAVRVVLKPVRREGLSIERIEVGRESLALLETT